MLGLNIFTSQSDVVSLNVMANDLGGNAKTLYSVDDGINYLTDLLHKDALTNGVSSWEGVISAVGGGDQIRIHNGAIDLDLSASIMALTGGSTNINALTATDHIHDTFDYAIQLGNGTLSWASVTVDIRGSNDAATISGTNTGAVIEDTPGHTSTGGTLSVHDPDHGESQFQAPGSLAGNYGNFTVDATTGAWTYTLDHDLANGLADGQVVHDTLTVKSLDGTASDTIDVSVTGTAEGAPKVLSIVQTDPSVTDAGTVHYQVTFSEPVTGVDASQFSIATTGGLSDAAITGVDEVSGSDGTQYIVSMGTGTGDGTLALVVNGNGIHDLMGQPLQGLFDPATNYQTDLYPVSVAIADLNGDGIADLATSNVGQFGASSASVMLGNGDGTFQARTDYATGNYALDVGISDLNGDSIPDLAVLNRANGLGGNSSVSVLLGNGDGTFQPQTSFGAGSYASGLAIGDLNGDGRPDLVTGHSEGVENDVSVLFNNGDGTFQSPVAYDTGGSPASVAIGDLNGDGISDIVAANATSDSVSVLLGNGDGTFQARTDYAAGSTPYSVAIADFNGDNKQDLVVTTQNNGYGFEGTVSVLLGNGDGTFEAPTSYGTGGLLPISVAVGDLNGDGKLDLAVTNSNSEAVALLLGDGNGAFQFQANYGTNGTTPHTNPTSVALDDLNADGHPDLAIANYVGNFSSTPTASVL